MKVSKSHLLDTDKIVPDVCRLSIPLVILVLRLNIVVFTWFRIKVLLQPNYLQLKQKSSDLSLSTRRKLEVCRTIKRLCLQALKIMDHHANRYFDWLVPAQQSVSPLRELSCFSSGKDKGLNFTFVYLVGGLSSHAVKRLCNSFSLRKVVILKESSAMLCIVISWFVCYLLNWNDLGNHLIYECMWQLHPNDNNYHYYLNDHCRLEALIFLVSFSISWHWRNALVNTFLQFARARETGDSLRRPNRKPSSFANEESLDLNQAPRINHAQIYDKVW